MASPVKASARTLAFRAVTIGLGIAYLVAALAFAHPGHVVDFGWPGRFNFGLSLLLGALVLYGGAWLFGKAIDSRGPKRAGWRGMAYGILTLLVAIVLAGGWNAAQDVLRFAPFPGTSAADFYRYVGYSCYDYIVKPLVWIMPLGSVVAGLLGWWVGRRRAHTSG